MILYRRKRRGKLKIITCSSGPDGMKLASSCCGGWKAWGYVKGNGHAVTAASGCCDCSGWYMETSAACQEGVYAVGEDEPGLPLYCDRHEIKFRFYLMAWHDDNDPDGCSDPKCTDAQIAKGMTDEACREQTKLDDVETGHLTFIIKQPDGGTSQYNVEGWTGPYNGGNTNASYPVRGCDDFDSGMTVTAVIHAPEWDEENYRYLAPKVEWIT